MLSSKAVCDTPIVSPGASVYLAELLSAVADSANEFSDEAAGNNSGPGAQPVDSANWNEVALFGDCSNPAISQLPRFEAGEPKIVAVEVTSCTGAANAATVHMTPPSNAETAKPRLPIDSPDHRARIYQPTHVVKMTNCAKVCQVGFLRCFDTGPFCAVVLLQH